VVVGHTVRCDPMKVLSLWLRRDESATSCSHMGWSVSLGVRAHRLPRDLEIAEGRDTNSGYVHGFWHLAQAHELCAVGELACKDYG